VRSRRPDPREPGGSDALIDQPPQRGRRGDRPERVLAIPPQLTDPVDAVRTIGHRGGQIGEHIPGRMRPRPLVGIRQRGCDLRGHPVRSATSRTMPTPVCDTTPWPSADTFTRETATLLFT
jgi:hypothetical protein